MGLAELQPNTEYHSKFSTEMAPVTTYRPYRYAGNPIIDLVPGSFYASFVGDPCVVVDPNDASRLMMFMSAVETQGSFASTIGLFTAPVSDPYTWTPYGNVVTQTDVWEGVGVRLGSVFVDSGVFYMYYTGIALANASASIGTATSSDGITWTKSASNPVLTPTGQGRKDGTHVSEPAVLKDGSSWTMLYAYRGAFILPGFRAATSSDGITWTKYGSGDVFTAPQYAEFHQLFKTDGAYYLVYESGNDTNRYKIYMAIGAASTGPFIPIQANPILVGSDIVGTFDRYHVATGNLTFINGQWHLFYQGAGTTDQPYVDNDWRMGVAIFASRQSGCGGGNIGR